MGSFTKKMERRQADVKALEREMANDKQQNQAQQAPAADKPLSIIQRVGNLEVSQKEIADSIPQLIMAVNQVLGKQQEEIELLREVCSVFSDMLDELTGEGEVLNRVNAARKDRAEKMVAAEKAALEKAVTDGMFTRLGKVEEPCIVIGRELDKDGNPVTTDKRYPFPTGHHQRYLSGYNAETKEKIQGQGVGFKFETGIGGSFEVLDIVRPSEKPVAGPEEPSPEEGAQEMEAEVTASLEPAASAPADVPAGNS